MPNRHTIVLDLDGTLITNKWPNIGDWQPGAIEACQRLHAKDIRLVVFSARLSPFDPFTFKERNPAQVETAIRAVREMLDEAGLTYVDIWTLPGKPGATVYVDDRAERYHGRPGSWRALTDKLIIRCGGEPAELPPFDQEVARATD